MKNPNWWNVDLLHSFILSLILFSYFKNLKNLKIYIQLRKYEFKLYKKSGNVFNIKIINL